MSTYPARNLAHPYLFLMLTSLTVRLQSSGLSKYVSRIVTIVKTGNSNRLVKSIAGSLLCGTWKIWILVETQEKDTLLLFAKRLIMHLTNHGEKLYPYCCQRFRSKSLLDLKTYFCEVISVSSIKLKLHTLHRNRKRTSHGRYNSLIERSVYLRCWSAHISITKTATGSLSKL